MAMSTVMTTSQVMTNVSIQKRGFMSSFDTVNLPRHAWTGELDGWVLPSYSHRFLRKMR